MTELNLCISQNSLRFVIKYKTKNMITLKIGDKAPDIVTKSNTVSLTQFKGKKIVLYFYPRDNTPGCTAEACNLKDNYAELQKQGYEVLGVSPDNEKSHQKFVEKFSLPFQLIPDPDKEILNTYGVYGEKMMYGKVTKGVLRTTFVIDEEGKIEKIIEKVKTNDHTAQIITT